MRETEKKNITRYQIGTTNIIHPHTNTKKNIEVYSHQPKWNEMKWKNNNNNQNHYHSTSTLHIPKCRKIEMVMIGGKKSFTIQYKYKNHFIPI